ncbi:uncharacterized protein METZ01_LOCUS167659 [marine metagenome]|uniref:Uncharacterized protein n=1 Tax=marine metagenome TaxID=408172 RepID=A0A382BLY9_9ZZZZ|tara:strand:+ start:294 stop:665 length:372 start_codon:yes stop_codon:yes gene_type:complete
MSYLSERFEVAIFALVGEGSIKQRLAEAYIEHLGDLDSKEFPSDLRQDFTVLYDALHRVNPGGKDSCVRASIRKMSVVEADVHAEMIVKLYSELLRNGRVNSPLSVVSKKEDKPLPRFLASVD